MGWLWRVFCFCVGLRRLSALSRPLSGHSTGESATEWRNERRLILRKSIIATALLTALGAISLAAPASAVPAGPALAVAAPADMITNVRMERRMVSRRVMHRKVMRHRMMLRHR